MADALLAARRFLAASALLSVSRTLILVAGAMLCLNATATLEAGFTLQLSYLLAGVAVAISPVHVLRGWRRLPVSLQISAGFVVLTFGVAAIIGDDAGLRTETERSTHRDLAYLGDVMLGLGLVGLSVCAFTSPRYVQWLIWALVAATVAAAAYAVYQWFAQHYQWPLADINTAPNSDGFTQGHRYQGSGLLGWERVRGAFKEPLYLGAFLATGLPLATYVARGSSERRPLVVLILVPIVLALVLTVSTLTWGVLMLWLAGAATLIAVRDGKSSLAALAGALFGCLLLLAPFLLANPSALATATGRSASDLQLTSENRIDGWRRAVSVWEREPLVGFGPGQSSVRLAYVPDVPERSDEPKVLGSAQGLWAAALIDTGIIGLAAWAFFIGGIFAFALVGALRSRTLLPAAAIASAAIAVTIAQLSGDRLDIRVWFALALLAAVAVREP